MNSEQTEQDSNHGRAAAVTRKTARAGRALVPLVIGVGVLAIIAIGATMVVRAEARVNKVALDQSAKPVTVIEAATTTFRPQRTYVGTLEPWVEAKVGPQMISAYVDT
ncbi:MAG TPA: hypothetical protein VGM44_12305, partial [Polyangiaceae bacterium]